ncbi:hypothetical protein FRB95_008088 [Tulasnella sp. JGI-2019a]|nr:hypothetical protein FRB95_008088 [Tulasnella sp. JGI-2019a]
MSSVIEQQEKDAWSSTLYNTNASFVYSKPYTSAVLSLLDAKPGEKIIDFGCGTGEITKELKEIVGETGSVVGTDFSQEMISKALQNGLKDVFVADAQNLVYPTELASLKGQFDAVFTNAALHWCKRDPTGVITSAREALRADGKGRFVGEFGGFLNCMGLRSVLHTILKVRGMDPVKLDPWFFPSAEEYKALLEKGGFQVTHISLNPRITPLPGSLVDWMRTFCRETWLANLPEQLAEEIMQLVEDRCTVDMRDSGGKWSVMYVRLRFVAILPSSKSV